MSQKSSRGVSRRQFVGSLAGLAVGAPLLAAGAAQNPQAKARRPRRRGQPAPVIEASKPNGLNLVVLICDTFRYDYLHCTGGNKRIQTPNLDALAEEGTLFTNCYADGLPTIPARRVMHTGRSILTERLRWRPLRDGDITLAQVLAAAGVTSGFIADTPHYFAPSMNFHRFFSSWEWIRGQESDRYNSGPWKSVRPETYVPERMLNPGYRRNVVQYVLNTKDRQGEEDYFCARSCAAAGRWLRENKNNGTPFMLFVDMFDPHEPWDAPPRFQKMYRDKYPRDRFLFGYGVNRRDIRDDDIPILRDLYSAEVTFSDYCIGKLVKDMKEMGLWDNTIVVFSTDHGTHLGEQGCVQKQPKLLNSCLAHVPLIIRHPDRKFGGKRIAELASHLDFTPTFLSLLGVKTNVEFDGGNLWDLASGGKLRDSTVTAFQNFGAVHTHKWHYFQKIWEEAPPPGAQPYIWTGASDLGSQLYDLEKDPHEQENVLPKHPDVVADMKAILEKSLHVEAGKLAPT
jgi:arylsulfatase A-like enzyme